MDAVTPPNTTTALRRRNSTATPVLILSKLSISTAAAAAAAATSSSSSSTSRTTSSSSSSSQSFSTVDFDLTSIPVSTSYTSLKDLLPSTAAAVNSPTSSGCGSAGSGYEISIRNRLVKQAAWAYLQPMSTSLDSDGRSFLHRLWIRFSGDLLNVIRIITRAFDGFLRAIRVRGSR